MYITQVFLQVQSGDKVLPALEAGKCYVPKLLLDVYFQGEPLSGLELTMVAVDEEAHVLFLDVAVQSTLPPALEATELACELHLEKRLVQISTHFQPTTLNLLVNCALMAQEMRLLGSLVIAKVTLESHISFFPIQLLHPGEFEIYTLTTKNKPYLTTKDLSS